MLTRMLVVWYPQLQAVYVYIMIVTWTIYTGSFLLCFIQTNIPGHCFA